MDRGKEYHHRVPVCREQRPERLPELAADLVRLKVDLIVVTGTPTALAAKKATTTIPIVMASVADPVGAGLVASLARPGGNVTGFSNLAIELNTKRLEILKDAVPKLARVGLLRSAVASIGPELQLKELRPAALALKLKLEEIETQLDAKGLESAFQTAKQKQVDAIMTTATRPFSPKESGSSSLPSNTGCRLFTFRRSLSMRAVSCPTGRTTMTCIARPLHYVDKILKGTKPADLPVQQATKFEFVINLKAAKQIGHRFQSDCWSGRIR